MTILPLNPIPSLVAQHRKLRGQMNALKSKMDDLKAELEPLVEAEPGNKWTDDIGYARIVTRKDSTSYDIKALDALLKSVSGIREVLEPHRSTRPGKSYLQIK